MSMVLSEVDLIVVVVDTILYTMVYSAGGAVLAADAGVRSLCLCGVFKVGGACKARTLVS